MILVKNAKAREKNIKIKINLAVSNFATAEIVSSIDTT
jgi:hypothetical protein